MDFLSNFVNIVYLAWLYIGTIMWQQMIIFIVKAFGFGCQCEADVTGRRGGVGRKCKVGPMVFWRPGPNWECHTYSSELTVQHLCHSLSLQRVYSGLIDSICDRKIIFSLRARSEEVCIFGLWQAGACLCCAHVGDVVHSFTVFLCCLDGEM